MKDHPKVVGIGRVMIAKGLRKMLNRVSQVL